MKPPRDFYCVIRSDTCEQVYLGQGLATASARFVSGTVHGKGTTPREALAMAVANRNAMLQFAGAATSCGLLGCERNDGGHCTIIGMEKPKQGIACVGFTTQKAGAA